MRLSISLVGAIALSCFGSNSLSAQSPLTPEQIIDNAYPSVALVLAGQAGSDSVTLGTAAVIRENGILLTAYHVVKNASSLQVRFRNGEAFDDVQLLGVDIRRDVAALKIAASGLPALPIGSAGETKPGEAVAVISHPAALTWSASSGIIAAYRLADEVAGAGSGYRLLQFTAAASPGSSGGVLIDSRGRALGVVVGSLSGGQNLNFAAPIENVLGLADQPASKKFANGAALNLPGRPSSSRQVSVETAKPTADITPEAPEKSDLLKYSKDPDYILRHFKTMYVNANNANYFGSEQLKAELGRNAAFAGLNIRIVDDPKLADVALEVTYQFAWDYPFQLKHQNTSTVLLAGKGSGPFSGPAGAISVAKEFVNTVRKYREQDVKKH